MCACVCESMCTITRARTPCFDVICDGIPFSCLPKKRRASISGRERGTESSSRRTEEEAEEEAVRKEASGTAPHRADLSTQPSLRNVSPETPQRRVSLELILTRGEASKTEYKNGSDGAKAYRWIYRAGLF